MAYRDLERRAGHNIQRLRDPDMAHPLDLEARSWTVQNVFPEHGSFVGVRDHPPYYASGVDCDHRDVIAAGRGVVVASCGVVVAASCGAAANEAVAASASCGVAAAGCGVVAAASCGDAANEAVAAASTSLAVRTRRRHQKKEEKDVKEERTHPARVSAMETRLVAAGPVSQKHHQ